MVEPCVESSGLHAEIAVNRDDLEASGLKQLQRGPDIVRSPFEHPGQHVHDLCEVDRADP